MKRVFVSLAILAAACVAGCSIEGRIGEPRYSEEEARQIQQQQQSQPEKVVEPVPQEN